MQLEVGERIKISRNNANLTQKQLAQKASISEIAIRLYETGKRNPKVETLQKIAHALGVSLSELTGKPTVGKNYITEQELERRQLIDILGLETLEDGRPISEATDEELIEISNKMAAQFRHTFSNLGDLMSQWVEFIQALEKKSLTFDEFIELMKMYFDVMDKVIKAKNILADEGKDGKE